MQPNQYRTWRCNNKLSRRLAMTVQHERRKHDALTEGWTPSGSSQHKIKSNNNKGQVEPTEIKWEETDGMLGQKNLNDSRAELVLSTTAQIPVQEWTETLYNHESAWVKPPDSCRRVDVKQVLPCDICHFQPKPPQTSTYCLTLPMSSMSASLLCYMSIQLIREWLIIKSSITFTVSSLFISNNSTDSPTLEATQTSQLYPSGSVVSTLMISARGRSAPLHSRPCSTLRAPSKVCCSS